jgi:sodium transport system ATP-binding protein
MIKVSEVRKHFGAVKAVDGMTFVAHDKQITTLLGGNGSGKTTTMRMIAGLIVPGGGEVSVDAIDVRRQRLRAMSRIGVLHDEFGLYPRLTVNEHIRYAGQLHGLSGLNLANAVDKAIAELGIEDIRHRFAAGFSHGQRMKTALARAIVHQPRNLILDEPARGLDIFSVRLLRELLKRLRDEGVCILMSSHVMADVAELSDRIVVIDQGRVLAEGTPGEIVALSGKNNLEEAFVFLVSRASERRAA